MQPYFYKMFHKPTKKFYIGSQYGKKSDPDKFWNSYTTSSKTVNMLIDEYGKESFEIKKIIIREDAREYEAKLLKRLYHFYGKDKFLELMINRNISPGILLTDEIIAKANVKRKVSNSIAAKKLIEQGRHNFQLKRYVPTEQMREFHSKRMKGNKLGSLRKITDEYRINQAEGAKGNMNVRGTKWWTNGKINKRSKECPGSDFYLGTTKK